MIENWNEPDKIEKFFTFFVLDKSSFKFSLNSITRDFNFNINNWLNHSTLMNKIDFKDQMMLLQMRFTIKY